MHYDVFSFFNSWVSENEEAGYFSTAYLVLRMGVRTKFSISEGIALLVIHMILRWAPELFSFFLLSLIDGDFMSCQASNAIVFSSDHCTVCPVSFSGIKWIPILRMQCWDGHTWCTWCSISIYHCQFYSTPTARIVIHKLGMMADVKWD